LDLPQNLPSCLSVIAIISPIGCDHRLRRFEPGSILRTANLRVSKDKMQGMKRAISSYFIYRHSLLRKALSPSIFRLTVITLGAHTNVKQGLSTDRLLFTAKSKSARCLLATCFFPCWRSSDLRRLFATLDESIPQQRS
jgi:hypothetical protein